MCFEFDMHTRFYARVLAPWISSITVMVALIPEKQIYTYRVNVASLTVFLRARYSASVVESVAHF